MKIATRLAPKVCASLGTTTPARRMPTGEVAALRPMISDSVPQDSIVRESRGKASPSEMVKTQTAAHAATTLRRLISDAGFVTHNSHATTRMGGRRRRMPQGGPRTPEQSMVLSCRYSDDLAMTFVSSNIRFRTAGFWIL